MSFFRRKKQTDAETESLKSFLDMIAPSIVKFETGYYICGKSASMTDSSAANIAL